MRRLLPWIVSAILAGAGSTALARPADPGNRPPAAQRALLAERLDALRPHVPDSTPGDRNAAGERPVAQWYNWNNWRNGWNNWRNWRNW